MNICQLSPIDGAQLAAEPHGKYSWQIFLRDEVLDQQHALFWLLRNLSTQQ